jgi:pilus assembly protein CpaB
MRTSTVIILAVAISMGGSAAYLTRNWLKDQTRASAAVQPAGTIVVAAESLGYGTAMTPDNIVEIPWFSNTLPEGAFAVKDDLLSGGRRVVLSPLKRGDPRSARLACFTTGRRQTRGDGVRRRRAWGCGLRVAR